MIHLGFSLSIEYFSANTLLIRLLYAEMCEITVPILHSQNPYYAPILLSADGQMAVVHSTGTGKMGSQKEMIYISVLYISLNPLWNVSITIHSTQALHLHIIICT